MRKTLLALSTGMFLVFGGVAAATVSAQPVAPETVQFSVDGTVSSAPGEAGVPFNGTVAVNSFIEQDGELAVQGRLTSTDEGPFAPLDVTVSALAQAFDDAGDGCTVHISTANAFVDSVVIVFLNGAQFRLSEGAEPGAARELCRVVQTATKDPADQQAIARALNKVLKNA
jgi:hypothetical protein